MASDQAEIVQSLHKCVPMVLLKFGTCCSVKDIVHVSFCYTHVCLNLHDISIDIYVCC